MFAQFYLLLCVLIKVVKCDNGGFIFYETMKIGEATEISPEGVLKYDNKTSWGVTPVLYSLPLNFKNSSKGNASSFSTTFVIRIVPDFRSPNRGLGMGFLIIPSKNVPGVTSSRQFGNGKATTSSDIFAFGAFCLEVACGRRPVKSKAPSEQAILVDWVQDCWRRGEILKTTDPKLKNEFKVEEMELVLKIGLLCSHPVAASRPRICQVLRYLEDHTSMPENLDALLSTQELNAIMSKPSVYETRSSGSLLTVTETLTGR
ncbi:unnamed protein product [Ilex paraguariensis]|uniref:Legume lectin domain-containing protein n=1 Tax=Ilex paraguariensis TaxID=185542 RepID=A0ABC8RWB5_9AQUA